MTGLQALATGGLDLAALDSSSTAELLEWHPTAGGQRPDADTLELTGPPQAVRLSDQLAGWWSTGTVYERTKPREPMRVDLGPLRWREADGALQQALVFRYGRPTARVLGFFHAASIRDSKRC